MSYKITDACNGCGACLRLCPVNAISGEKGKLHVIDGAICIECGVCGRICTQMSVLDSLGIICNRIKRSEWPKPIIDKGLCMSCTICLESCPVACLVLSEAGKPDDPHAYPFLKQVKACIGCGFCAMDCPVNAITMSIQVREDKEQVAPKR